MASHSVAPLREDGHSTGVRQELSDRLPGILQRPLTILTGCPSPGENPLVVLPTPVLVGAEAVALGASFAVGTLPFAGSAWAIPLLPYAFCTAVGRLRWFQTELAHFGVHESMRWHRGWSIIGTVVPLAQNEQEYAEDHLGSHHPLKTFGTPKDPDARTLIELGFREGTPEHELWVLLARSLVSPRFHWMFLKSRLQSNLIAPGWKRRFVAALWLVVLMSLLAIMPLAGWVVMVAGTYTVGYQCSALLQFLSEHLWLSETPSGLRRSVGLSHGRFCGEAPPEEGSLGWVRWTRRMLTIHLCTRLAVLPGTLPAHDAHHVAQREFNPKWRSGNYIRGELVTSGRDLGMDEREAWGLKAAIHAVFRSLANH